MTSSAAVDNQRHTTDASEGIYEVWYLTWNHAATNTGYWLRYTLEYPSKSGPGEPAEPHAEVWFARFDHNNPSRNFGVHRRFAGASVNSTTAPFSLNIAASRLTHQSATGSVAGAGHAVSWRLEWQPSATSYRQLPDIMYARGGVGETTVLSPNVRVLVDGELFVDGQRIDLKQAVLGQTHLWGRKHAHSWAWGRCAEFSQAPDAWLEALSVRLVRGGVTLPPLTLVSLGIDGEVLQFNQFRHTALNRSTWRTGHYEMTAVGGGAKLRCVLSAPTNHFITAPYRDPDGTSVFCANTEVGDAHLTLWRRAGLGWGNPRELTSTGNAHFETGSAVADPAVPKTHILLT